MPYSNSIDFFRGTNGWVENLGCAVSGTTFTIQSPFATALSLRNAAYITLPSATTPGTSKVYRRTSNASMTTGAASDIAGQRFGLTSGVAWNSDIPFFLYAVSDSTETTIAFMISRNPCARVTPAAGSIGKAGATVNVGDRDFFSLDNVTVANYAAQSCLCIGTVLMRFNASNYFTIQALTSGSSGIGVFAENRTYQVDTGIFGAATGSYFRANGGTAPIWDTQQMTFQVAKSGEVTVNFQYTINSTAGAGAVAALMILPYMNQVSTYPLVGKSAQTNTSTGLVTQQMIIPVINDNCVAFFVSGATANVLNSALIANNTLAGMFRYYPFLVGP